jgi:hypothetical protein
MAGVVAHWATSLGYVTDIIKNCKDEAGASM